MHLLQHRLCTRKNGACTWGEILYRHSLSYMTMATNADQRKWHQIYISTVSWYSRYCYTYLVCLTQAWGVWGLWQPWVPLDSLRLYPRLTQVSLVSCWGELQTAGYLLVKPEISLSGLRTRTARRAFVLPAFEVKLKTSRKLQETTMIIRPCHLKSRGILLKLVDSVTPDSWLDWRMLPWWVFLQWLCFLLIISQVRHSLLVSPKVAINHGCFLKLDVFSGKVSSSKVGPNQTLWGFFFLYFRFSFLPFGIFCTSSFQNLHGDEIVMDNCSKQFLFIIINHYLAIGNVRSLIFIEIIF